MAPANALRAGRARYVTPVNKSSSAQTARLAPLVSTVTALIPSRATESASARWATQASYAMTVRKATLTTMANAKPVQHVANMVRALWLRVLLGVHVMMTGPVHFVMCTVAVV